MKRKYDFGRVVYRFMIDPTCELEKAPSPEMNLPVGHYDIGWGQAADFWGDREYTIIGERVFKIGFPSADLGVFGGSGFNEFEWVDFVDAMFESGRLEAILDEPNNAIDVVFRGR